jgi:hypothetical protein
MSAEKTAAESADLQLASPTKGSISGMEDKLLFLGGATSISVSWAWRASPNSPSLRDGRQIAFFGRRNQHFCVLEMARKSKLPEPCVPVQIDEQIHGSYVAVHNLGAKKNEEQGSPSPFEEREEHEEASLILWSRTGGYTAESFFAGCSNECKLSFSMKYTSRSLTVPSCLYPSKVTSSRLKTLLRMST